MRRFWSDLGGLLVFLAIAFSVCYWVSSSWDWPITKTFEFNSFWFWALIIGLVIAELFSVNNDSWVAGILLIVGCSIVLALASTINVFVWAFHNPTTFLAGIGIYILVGAINSIVEWYIINIKELRLYNKAREDYLNRFELTEIEGVKKGEWLIHLEVYKQQIGHGTTYYPGSFSATSKIRELKEDFNQENKNFNEDPGGYRQPIKEIREDQIDKWVAYVSKRYPPIPQVKDHKDDLIVSVYLWPFTILHRLFFDLVREIGIYIYNKLTYIWELISNAVFKGVKKDFT